MTTTSQPPANIMVVDDQPANLKLMEDMLRRQGYGVRSFPRGRMALEAAAGHPPDLILLDVNMPEMDGFEVCARLKSDERLSAIPVVFLSARQETGDKVKGFQAGGVDYIAKPFEFEEVQARVDTHLRLHFLQRELKVYANNLEELVALRTSQLAETQSRLKVLDRTKGDFLKLISHEFRTPLNGLFGVSQLLLGELNPTPEHNELRDIFEQSRQRILAILEDALLLTQIDVEGEKFAPRPVPLHDVLTAAIAQASEFAGTCQVAIEAAPAGMGWTHGQEDLLAKALQRLLETAVKFSTQGEVVRMEADRPSAGATRITIDGCGQTIPDDAMPRLFDVFSIGEAITLGGNLGLGLPVAHRIVVLFGGSVTVVNREPSGIRISVCLKHANWPRFAGPENIC